jgi:serine/threonine protein kinase
MSEFEIGGYSLLRRLGSGGYGEIYAAQRANDPTIYAIKTETVETQQKAMDLEISVLKMLPNASCFTRVISHGSTAAIKFFVMPLYGPSLASLLNLVPAKHFSLQTAFYAAKQMLQILKLLHSYGFAHCDVKPSNFLIQQKSIGGLVLIDFGLSSKFLTEDGKHIDSKTSDGFRGTLRYASVNVHKFLEPTRRDDVISWFYSFIEMAKGSLPWSEVHDKNLSMSCKQTITPERLCQGLPEKLVEVWRMVKDLKFEEEPSYDEIIHILDEISKEQQWSSVTPLDWEQNAELLKQSTPFPELFNNEISSPDSYVSSEEQGCCRL